MALCERCEAEIVRPIDRLPLPWFDDDAHTIAGQFITLIHWRLLEILWRRRGKMVTRDTIMTLLYDGHIDPPEERNITVYACGLRRALKQTPFAIETEPRRGYRLTASLNEGFPNV